MPRVFRLAAPALALPALILGLTPLLPAGHARAAAPRASLQSFSPTAPTTLGYDRIGLRRGGSWFLRSDLGPGISTAYAEGLPGDVPVAGDLDADGDDSISLWRDGLWMLRNSTGGAVDTVQYGQRGDVPLLGDWDGNGTDTLAVFRSGTWFFKSTNHGTTTKMIRFGGRGDRPVAGDWNGDGRTDIAVLRGNRFYQQVNGRSLPSFAYGVSGDLPVAGDWDHDGTDTLGLFHAATGTWNFRSGNGLTQRTVYGATGDLPVVRRVRGLAPGVSHQVLRDPAGPFVADVTRVVLSAASSPDTVLGGGRLGVLEPPTAMARRANAVAAINGDYFLGSGRPVHAFAADGRLVQTEQLRGRAVGLTRDGLRAPMGFPTVQVTAQNLNPTPIVTDPPAPGPPPVATPVADPAATATPTATADPAGAPPPAATAPPAPAAPLTAPAITRWNAGPPSGSDVAGYTAASTEAPPVNSCFAVLEPTSGSGEASDGTIQSNQRVTASDCGVGSAPPPAAAGQVLAALPSDPGADLVRSLPTGADVRLRSQLGFPGAVDLIGGTPQVVVDGAPAVAGDLDGDGSGFFQRQPRTAVGITGDGTLLLVVVDGRQPGYSAGMTLRELSTFMLSLGARNAMNLDGGGSSVMWVNGLVVNRPSDGFERSVSNAVVVLPGADPGQVVLGAAPALRTPPPAALVARQLSDGWSREAGDPAGTGGLSAALLHQGAFLPTELRRVARAYDATH